MTLHAGFNLTSVKKKNAQFCFYRNLSLAHGVLKCYFENFCYCQFKLVFSKRFFIFTFEKRYFEKDLLN